MLGTREQKRSEYIIGKEQYKFDFNVEKSIYSYVYGRFPRKYKKLKEENKYKNYSEWKEYVENKYKDDSSKELSDFSHYLCQMNENENPTRNFWNICIPIFMTVIVANVLEMTKNSVKIDFSGATFLNVMISIIVICLLTIPLLYWLIYKIMLPLWECNLKENLLREYREIIDDMIIKKTKEEKKLEKKRKKKRKKKSGISKVNV